MKHLAMPVFAALLALPSPGRAFVEVTEISARPSAFSPNGDGVNDSTYLSFTTSSDAKSVRIYVDVVTGADTVAVLAHGEDHPTGPVGFTWDGTETGGAPAPEGIYDFVIVAADEYYTTPPLAVSVRLDITPPRFSTHIHPSPYTPDLPLADSLLTVDLAVTDAQGGDLLTVAIGAGDPPETLCIYSLAPADSTYSCSWDGRDHADGEYDLHVRSSDPAGNSMEASYVVDLDVSPPEISIESPAESFLDYIPTDYWVTAADRNGVDSLKVRFYAGTGYMTPDGYPRDECCYAWPESLRIEDEFLLECVALDGVGHWGSTFRSVLVDTTPPERPVISPLPAKVGAPDVGIEGTGTALDSVRVYVNGGIQRHAKIKSDGTWSTVITLDLGPNTIFAVSSDLAGNVSAPSETTQVEYTEETGIYVPEEFTADSVIEINVAREPRRIVVRVFSLEGSYVAGLTEDHPGLFNELEWDLTDADGRQVKNGVYVFVIEVAYADGSTDMDKKAVVVSR